MDKKKQEGKKKPPREIKDDDDTSSDDEKGDDEKGGDDDDTEEEAQEGDDMEVLKEAFTKQFRRPTGLPKTIEKAKKELQSCKLGKTISRLSSLVEKEREKVQGLQEESESLKKKKTKKNKIRRATLREQSNGDSRQNSSNQ